MITLVTEHPTLPTISDQLPPAQSPPAQPFIPEKPAPTQPLNPLPKHTPAVTVPDQHKPKTDEKSETLLTVAKPQDTEDEEIDEI